MRFSLLLGVLFFAPLTLAQNTSHIPKKLICGKATSSGIGWKYCLHEYPNSSRKVLYYLHGILGSEHDWKNHELERGIVRRWIERGLKPPIVVSMSMGPVWLLTEKNKSKHSGGYEVFHQEILPTLKNKLGFKSEEDWLMGVSMGGFNASQLYFKNPSLFKKTALICPAMTTVDPYVNKQGFDDYIYRTGAIPFLVWLSQLITKEHIPDALDWPKHSPIDLGTKYFSRDSKPLYVSNGTRDEFGFHEGDIRLTRIAYERGVPITSHFFTGKGHCYVDSKPIADFFYR